MRIDEGYKRFLAGADRINRGGNKLRRFIDFMPGRALARSVARIGVFVLLLSAKDQ
jgi:hypothetical protein